MRGQDTGRAALASAAELAPGDRADDHDRDQGDHDDSGIHEVTLSTWTRAKHRPLARLAPDVRG